MGTRGARSLKHLYGLTDRIADPEIRSVLEGSCRMRGPVDEPENRLLKANSGMLPTKKGYAFVNENSQPRTESGACNMCSAPCSSCMHLRRTGSLMESFRGNTLGRKEDDCCSFICTDGLPLYKSRACDDNQHAASEASNLLSPSSSNGSYSENAESKTTCRASVKHEASDAVDMPSKASSSVEAKNDLLRLANVTNCFLSSQSHISSDFDHQTFLSQDEEQRGSEWHGDSISCITGARGANVAVGNHVVDRDKKEVTCSSASTSSNLFGKQIDNVVQVKYSHGFRDHRTEEKQSNSRSSNLHDTESSGDKRTGLNPAKVGISGKPGLAELSLSKTIASAKVQSPSFNSQKGDTFHHNTNSEVLERNSCSHVQTETSDYPIGNLNSSSGGPLASGSVNKRKLSALPIYEDNIANFSRRDDFSADLKHTDPCLESEIHPDAGISSDDVMKCNNEYEQLENNKTFEETSNMQVPQVQDKLNMEGEHSKSESGLYDVKVCDICGDAGIEELLAICSRCSDGAEHTYCMRKKLEKLPEGDWLCEECKTKEDTAIPKADKSESVSRTPKLAVLNGTRQNVVGTFNRKLLPKLNTKTHNQEFGGVVKGLRSPEVSSTRHTGSLADCSVPSKRASEASYGSTGSDTPRKKTVCCRETSSKNLDMGTVKPVSVEPFGTQSANNPPAFSRLGSDSFKIPARLQSPRLPVSRSNSFNGSNWKPSPRVKPLSETVIPKLKPGREYSSIDSRKDRSSRTMSKSSSFKTRSSDLSNIESSGRMQSLVLPRSEDLSGLKQLKESHVLSKKNFSVPDHPSPLAGTDIPPPKGDAKVPNRDGGLQNTSESKGLSIRKIAHDGNSTEVKKPSSSKYSESHSSKRRNNVDKKPFEVSKDGIHANSVVYVRSCNKADAVMQHDATKVADYVLCDDKTKDAIVHDDKTKESYGFNSSHQVASGGNQVIYCQRCNETGHSTQICPTDKLLTSALQPPLERNITERGIKRSNKWKDSGKAANKKIGVQNDNRLPDQLKDSLSPSVDLICGTTSNVILANSSACVGRVAHLPCPEGSAHGREIMRSSDAGGSQTTDIDMSKQVMHAVEASYVPTEIDSNIIRVSDGSNIKSSEQIFSNQAYMLTNSLRTSVFPELEFIWHGCFDVMSTGRFPRLFNGIQAHLSNCASPEVPKVVTDLPCKIELEEVPRMNSWFSQFQGTSPKEDNIALFFFAKDIESYEKNYSKLLENMLANDLALRGNINGVELLILPSNLLPASCQCWNGLFFLWGVFWERKNCLESLPGSQKKLCRSISCRDPLVRDLPSPLFNDVSDPQKIVLMENQNMELTRCDRASKVNSMITSSSIGYRPILSCRIDNRTCNTVESSLVGNPSYQTTSDCQLPSKRSPSTLNCSPVSMNGCSTSLDSCLESSLQSSAKMLCQGNIDAASLKDAITGSVGQVDPLSRSETGQSRFRTLPSNVGSSNCTQDIEDCPSEEKMREEKKLGGASSEDPQGKTESNRIIWEPTVDWKRAGSFSMEKMSCDSSENSRSKHFIWEPIVDRKRAGSFLMEKMPRDCSENSRSTGGTNWWKETKKSVNIEDEREHKKMELCVDGHATNCFGSEILGGRTSSKVHSHIDSSLNVQQHGDVVNKETTTGLNTICAKESATVVNSRGAERVFLQADLDSFSKLDNVIHISSDDEDFPESSAPFLKLSLGCETRLGKNKELPLLFPPSPAKGDTEQEALRLLFPLDRIDNQGRPPCPAADDDTSLSLSLGLSSACAKPILKTDELMPDAPHVNTSLILFSGVPET